VVFGSHLRGTKTMKIGIINVPLGSVMLTVENGKLISVKLFKKTSPEEKLSPFTDQFIEYFSGKRKEFDLPYSLELPEFSLKVLEFIKSIPYGSYLTYKQVAERFGKPGAARAIGQAMGRNPLPILLPCHRVVAKKGLGGYTGGLDWKKYLLNLEGAIIGAE